MSKEGKGFGQSDLVRLSDEETAVTVISGAVQGLWDVVNQLTRLRRTARSNYRVTIFGSARLKPHTADYEAVRNLAASLTAMGCDIVTGGGPGLMQAANEGATSAGQAAAGRSVGIRIELPFEQAINPYVDQAFEHRTFFSRLHHFALVSDAFVVTPGGVGSLLEMSLVWQLLQVGQMHEVPLVLVGNMWSELLAWGRRHMLVEGQELASPEDFSIPHCATGIDDALEVLAEHRRRWLAAQGAAAAKNGSAL